jgi:AcrR family transcriptional regulator
MCSVIALSTKESIVCSALQLFGSGGIESTSLREIAKAAEVSPALVVHHFGSKQGLVAAADEAAVREFADAYALEEPDPGADPLRLRAEGTARVMRERPDVCAYLGRAMVEGTEGSSRLLRLMLKGGQAEIDSLAQEGALRPDADRLWTTLQHFFLIWAPLSFLPLLEETLGAPLLEEEQLDRWVQANVELLRGGLYR